uniref:Uncharacterized protein n=1 Tax=Heterorhabditis bacteriophora TaxID=37862 RepID=A0A1I7WNV6_HETBA
MLYVWWDWEGILHYELLERNQTERPNRQHGVLLLHGNKFELTVSDNQIYFYPRILFFFF